MKTYALLLCLIILTAPCFAETKQSAPLSIQPETKQSAPLSIQPGTTMLTLNKMCQENANTRSYAVCMAYLRGLFDGMQQAKIVEHTNNTFGPPQTPTWTKFGSLSNNGSETIPKTPVCPSDGPDRLLFLSHFLADSPHSVGTGGGR